MEQLRSWQSSVLTRLHWITDKQLSPLLAAPGNKVPLSVHQPYKNLGKEKRSEAWQVRSSYAAISRTLSSAASTSALIFLVVRLPCGWWGVAGCSGGVASTWAVIWRGWAVVWTRSSRCVERARWAVRGTWLWIRWWCRRVSWWCWTVKKQKQ